MPSSYNKSFEGETLKSFNILILLVLISSLFPYQVIADDGQIQVALSSLDEGHGYFSLDKTATSPNQFVNNSYVIGQEVVEMRTENSKTVYLGKEGNKDKYSLDVSMGPVHYKDDYSNPYEQWKDIDLTFENGKITKAPYELTVDGNSITVRDKKTNSIVALTLSEIGAKSVPNPTLSFSKGKATAKNIALDTDLEISADNSRVKFTRVLKSNKAPVESKFGLSKVGEGIVVDYQAQDSSINKKMKVNASLKDGVLTESVDTTGVNYPLRVDPTLDISIAADADDVNQSAGVFLVNPTNMYLGNFVGAPWGGGFRFTNVTIPHGSVISTSYIVFTCQTATAVATCNLKISGDNADNSAAWSTEADYLARNATSVVVWDAVAGWTLDNTYNTPSLNTPIGEITSRAGWASGNAMSFKVTNNGSTFNADRQLYDYNISAAKSTQLHVEYKSTATMSTIGASNIEETTATVGGNVTDMGAGNITSYGIQYGNTTSYGSWCNITTTKTAVFSYYCYLGTNTSALDPGELYYYRAWSYDNVLGYGYGDIKYFQTKPLEPSPFACTTVNSTAISYSWAKGTGATNTTVRYQLGHYVDNVTDGASSYNDTGITNTQTGLVDANTYYFSAWSVAIETGNITYSDLTGNCSSLTYDAPTVTTTAASSIAETTATTGGSITASPFAITAYGVQYGTTGTYGSTSNGTTFPATPPWAYSQGLSSLTKGELYYFRAFATHNLGAGYGSQLTFLTKPDSPVLTLTALNVTSIRISWVVGTGANYTMIRYSNTTGVCPPTPVSGVFVANVTSPTNTYDLSGLVSLQTYYVSAWSFATEGGLEQYSTVYGCGSQLVPGAPIVVTNSPSGYGNDWVSVSGTQTGGYPPSTLFGFQYGPTIAYGSWSNTTTTVSGGMFSVTIPGLTPSSSYHYRAFASNPYGIGYGADMTFSTAGTAILYESHLYGCNTTWSQLYESTAANITSNYTATQVFGNNWTAQTFTTTQSHSVHQVVLWASRSATAAAGYMYVSIREATTDNVTSPDLAIGLYSIAYVSTTGGPIEVSLENEIQLDTTKKYAIVVRAPGADSTNYVSLWSSNTSGTSIYAGGNAIRSVNGGGVWQSYTGYDVYFSIIGRPQPIYGNVQAAQSFTVGASPHTAYKVRLILGRIGQPGNVYVSIRNYTGGVISNADLAVVALNGNAVTLDKASYDCVLVPEKSLEANKQYAIVVTAPSGDRYNYILMCADAGAGYASGTALMSIDSGITWVAQTFDYNFEVWGNACLNVLNAKVFKNYLVTGDWLITAETLNVSPPYYDSNQDPSTLFILSFMGLTGTTYASTPCELWEKGPIVIYLNPTQASALTWGGNYKVRLSDLTGTVYSEYGLLPTDWSASSLIYLDNWVRLVAKDMEAYKTAKTGATVTYLTYAADKGYVLNQDGGAIFNQACPRLSYVRPNIFQVTSNTPDIPTTTVPTPGATTSETYKIRLGSYLSGLIDQGAGAAGIGDPKVFGGIIMVAIYLIIAFGTVIKGFAWAGMIAAFPIWLLGMYYGLIDVQLSLIIIVIVAFLFVREFWWKGG